MKNQIQAVMSKATTMADNTVRLTFDCQETTPDMMAEMFEMKNQIGWLFFQESRINLSDLASLPEIKVEKGQKTPSERLRAVLYVLWESQPSDMSFDNFYINKMNQLIDWVKAKLPEKT